MAPLALTFGLFGAYGHLGHFGLGGSFGFLGNLGATELLIIFGILLMIFGASRLPKLGEALGKSIRGLKRGLNSDDDIEVGEKRVTEKSSATSVGQGDSNIADADVVNKK